MNLYGFVASPAPPQNQHQTTSSVVNTGEFSEHIFLPFGYNWSCSSGIPTVIKPWAVDMGLVGSHQLQ